MKQIIKKLLGVDKLEAELNQVLETKKLAEQETELAQKAAEEAKEQERISKLTPKERATANKEPWVAVLETHVNKENIRNGFFELDWNEYFIIQLRQNGFRGTTDEDVVDSWFSELCRTLGNETGVDMDRRGSGYVNRALRDDGKTEIS